VDVPGLMVTSSKKRLCNGVNVDIGVAGVVLAVYCSELCFRGGVTTKGSLFSSSSWVLPVVIPRPVIRIILESCATCQ